MPARKPTHLKVLSGTLRKHRLKHEPQPPGGIGAPPRAFTKEEKKVWKELCAICPDGLLTSMDRPSFELLVKLLVEYRSGQSSARKIQHLLTLFSRFGLSPVDRSRIDLPQHKRTNPFSALEAERKKDERFFGS